jgi:hypothetical protein
MFMHDMVREHQHRCRYRPQTCPLNKIPNLKCEWTGIYDNIKQHLMDKHPGDCYEYVDGEIRNLKNIAARMCVCQFVFALSQVFFLRIEANDDSNFYALLQYIGPAENATNYQYKFTFINKDNTEGVTVMHLTRSFHESLYDVFKSGNCGKLHYDVVSRLQTNDCRLRVKVEVLRVGD